MRELYVDRKTLELQEVVATDKLYEEDSGNHVYPMLFTVTLGWMNNMPIVTHIHGTPTYQADADYLGRDATVDYDFNDITFPAVVAGLVFRSALLRGERRERAALGTLSLKGALALTSAGYSWRSFFSFGRSLKTM